MTLQPTRRPLAILVVLALLAPSTIAVAAPWAAPPPPDSQTAAKKKKKKTKRKSTCLVKRRVGGRLIQVYVRKRVLTVVKRGGQLVVTKKTVFVKKRGRCKVVKKCVIKKRVNGKLVTQYKTVTRRVRKRRNGRVIVVRKKVKVPKKGKCPKKTKAPSTGTPITLTLQSPSNAVLDFNGDGTTLVRSAELSGTIKGFTEGPLKLNQPNVVKLSAGDLHVSTVNIFVDDLCGNEVTPTIRTGPATEAILDDSRVSTSTVDTQAQTITAIVHLKLRVSIELRNGDDGCHNEYIKTGYTEMPVQALFKGKLDTTGGNLTAIIDSNQALVDDATACVSPGEAAQPCNGFVIPFPFLLTSHVVAAVALGN
jgi:hypothetical protein